MRKQSLFTKERLVYWPDEYSPVVNMLCGRDAEGRQAGVPLYAFNTGPIVLAASIGLKHGRKRDLGTKRNEISTVTFANHELEAYLFLIPLLGNPDSSMDQLRPENEEIVLREFERYAAGGLEYLSGEIEASAAKSADLIVQGIALQRSVDVKGGNPLPDLNF